MSLNLLQKDPDNTDAPAVNSTVQRTGQLRSSFCNQRF